MRPLEVKGALELDAPRFVAPAQVILDDRDQVLAQGLDVRERERIDDGQALGQRAIAELEGAPAREVVAVGGGHRPVTEEVAERVEEDRLGRHLLQAVPELALVERVDIERLP